MEDVIKFIEENDKIKTLLGIEVLETQLGSAKTRMLVKLNMLNAANVCHGGVIFSLADFTFALASNSYGKIALAISANINFANPAFLNDGLIAFAKELNRTKNTGLYEILIKRESDEKLIALFTGEVFIKKDKML